MRSSTGASDDSVTERCGDAPFADPRLKNEKGRHDAEAT
jgi:hypothetical protein